MRLLFLLAATAFALSAQAPAAQGYGFFGLESPAGHTFGYSSVGAGADVFVYKGAAVSPSAGYLFANGNDGGHLGVVTVNGSYHFLRGKGPLEPFVTAGYGAFAVLGDGQAMFNYGGGVNYWFKKRIGFRAEVLNFQTRNYRELTSIRFGVSFR
jgi:hypothetical protein